MLLDDSTAGDSNDPGGAELSRQPCGDKVGVCSCFKTARPLLCLGAETNAGQELGLDELQHESLSW